MILGSFPLADSIVTNGMTGLNVLQVPANTFNAVRCGKFLFLNKRTNEC